MASPIAWVSSVEGGPRRVNHAAAPIGHRSVQKDFHAQLINMTHTIWVIQSESYKSDYVRECYDTAIHFWPSSQLFNGERVRHFRLKVFSDLFVNYFFWTLKEFIYLVVTVRQPRKQPMAEQETWKKDRLIFFHWIQVSTWYRGPHNRYISCFYCCIRIDVICLFDSQTTPRSFLHSFKCNLLFSCIVA